MTAPRNLRNEQAERTRAALLAAGRALFAEKGYFATGTHEIVDRAKVTRGALYHHFPQKDGLFRAVFHAVQADFLERSAIDDGERLPGQIWQTFRERLTGFLHAATLPEVQRILLQDGPAVLGWSEWRELEAHYGLGYIRRSLADGMAAGLVRAQPPDPLALLILAAINEAALFIANSTEPETATSDAAVAMDTLLHSLA